MCGYYIEIMVEGCRALDEMIKVSVEQLKYAVDSNQILKGVSLEIPQGKMIGVIGPNGSGKTTTLKHIYRAINPKRGVVFIDGKDIHDFSYRESAKEMTVMKQEHNTDFSYNIYEMVMMGRTPYRKMFEADTKEDREVVLKALQYVGMEKYVNRSYTELSGGEKQRVMIARSLAQGTEIFILDEPTNHLDVHYQWALMHMIHNLNKTVIAVFHELNLAANYCDELYVINDGKIVDHGVPADILTSQMLAEVFKIEAEVMRSKDGMIHILFKRAITE